MRRIYRAVLVAYTDSAWLAAFTAQSVWFLSPCYQRLARAPQLSSAGHQGELSRAREKRHSSSADFSVVIEKSERSHDNDTEEIDRIGKPHGKEDPVRGLQMRIPGDGDQRFRTIV